MTGEKPSHRAYVVDDKGDGEAKEGFWMACGAAWPHRDGKGFNVQLAQGLSVAGRLVLREVSEEPAKSESGKGAG